MKITKRDSKFVKEVVEAADIYRPTDDQRRVKAEFHMLLASGPRPKNLTAAFAVQLTGRSVVEKWWSIDGFRKWFLEATTFDSQAEALAGAALGIIGDIMYAAEKDSDRLAAAKCMIEIAGKMKKNKPEIRFLDETLPDDVAGLDEYINKATGGSSEN